MKSSNRWFRAFATVALLAAGAALTGCEMTFTGLDFDRNEYDPIPELDALDWESIDPQEEWRFWEFRDGTEDSWLVLGSGGTMTREELDPELRAAIESTRAERGFGAGCPPLYCYSYLVTVADSIPTVVTTRDGLQGFLAPIGSAEEAILMVSAIDYVRWDDGGKTGVRPVDGGWDLVVFQLTNHCSPVQTDHVRFHVDSEGSVIERERTVWKTNPNACI